VRVALEQLAAEAGPTAIIVAKTRTAKQSFWKFIFYPSFFPQFLYIFFIRNLLFGRKTAVNHTPIPLFADSV
jgi:hypothetical protein